MQQKFEEACIKYTSLFEKIVLILLILLIWQQILKSERDIQFSGLQELNEKIKRKEFISIF